MTAETSPIPPKFPFSDGTSLEIEPEYAELRRRPTMTRVVLPYAGEAWLATRMEENRLVLTDPRFSRAALERPDVPRFTPEPVVGGLGTMDPPEHTRRRKLLSQAFTRRRVEQWRGRVREIAEELLDEMERVGPPADLVADFAFPVPCKVLCEILGVPYEHRHRFVRFLDAVATTGERRGEVIEEAWAELTAYFSELIAERRRAPTDDLLSDVVTARDEGDRFTDTEILDTMIGVLAAGYETTGSEIALMTYTLLQHPDQLALLQQDPKLVPGAVEELLRYIPLSSIGGSPYVAKEDIEMGGVVVRAGEAVIPCTISANRDEEVFDSADRLQVTRERCPHLTFSLGAHHCLGAGLARVELQEAMGALIARFPRLRLAVDVAELRTKEGLVIRGFRELPVAW
ncbi:cytochrome P450 [Marinactinospora thermotolerans]|uniref:Cytochrome P450 n=1 Tax=Marinactinospora thermotolerans DSM 45154 TaxID=1122192 RepID=A0A1T4KIJ3_9ACTN|nr:cytochrome P450 [Marinactinospora thermotolerans]SJZ42211.1 Cytochrome P450 [Marinactinospora thermotolerans DSM 45154]